MKKNSLLSLLLCLLCLPLGAQVDKAFCEQAFSNHGTYQVETECLSLGLSNATITLQYGDDILAASSNAVFIKKDNVIELLAGDQTQLDSPVALVWNKKKREIYVLLKSGDVNVYHDFVLGNIAPKRTIKNKELPGSTAISVGPKTMALLNANTNRILLIDREANSRAGESKRKDKVLKTIELPGSKNFIALGQGEDTNEFYLAKKNGELFSLHQNGALKNLNVSTESTSIYALDYDANKKALIIRAQNGHQEIKLP